MFSSKIQILYNDIYQAYTENKIYYLKICKIISIYYKCIHVILNIYIKVI